MKKISRENISANRFLMARYICHSNVSSKLVNILYLLETFLSLPCWYTVIPNQNPHHLFTLSGAIRAMVGLFLGSKVNFFVPAHKPMTMAQGFDKTAYNFSLPMKCKNSLWSGFISNTLKCFESVVSSALLCWMLDINFRRTKREQMNLAAAKESIMAVIIEHLFGK